MGRILALDVGDVRIGIAVTDPTRTIAQPLETYHRVGWGPDSRYMKALCEKQDADLVLCGLPLNMDGTEGFQAQKVRQFAAKLEELGLPVVFQDERLTTVTAEDVLIAGNVGRQDRKKYVDKLAAAVILEQYLAASKEEKPMEENFENEIITLTDQDGNEVEFEHEITVEYNGSYYVVLTATEDMEDCMAGESIILKIIRDPETDEDMYAEIESEEEYNAVYDLVMETIEDEDGGEAEYGEYDEDGEQA